MLEPRVHDFAISLDGYGAGLVHGVEPVSSPRVAHVRLARTGR